MIHAFHIPEIPNIILTCPMIQIVLFWYPHC